MAEEILELEDDIKGEMLSDNTEASSTSMSNNRNIIIMAVIGIVILIGIIIFFTRNM